MLARAPEQARQRCAGEGWQYLGRNPALDAGRNPEPRAEELLPFTAEEVEALAVGTGPAVRGARHLRCGDGAADERVGRAGVARR